MPQTPSIASSASSEVIDPLDVALAQLEPDQVLDAPPPESQLLGFFSVVCLFLNRTIGSGIFVSPALVLHMTRSLGGALFIWAAGAIAAFCTLAVWLELGLTIPTYTDPVTGIVRNIARSGGEKNFLEYIFHKPRLLATCSYGFLFIALGTLAGNSIMLARYLLRAAGKAPYSGDPTNENLDIVHPQGGVTAIAIAAITLTVFIHMFSRRGGILINNIFAVVKVLFLCAIIVMAFVYAYTNAGVNYKGTPNRDVAEIRANITANFATSNSFKTPNGEQGPDGASALTAILYVFYSYSGYLQPMYVLGEVRSPRKILPKATVTGMIITIVLYTFMTACYWLVVPASNYVLRARDAPNLDLPNAFFSTMLGPELGNKVLNSVLVISIFGNLLVMTYTSARVKQEIAKEGVLPFSRFFAKVHVTPLAWIQSQFRSHSLQNQGRPNKVLEQAPIAGLFLHWMTSIITISCVSMLRSDLAYTVLVTLYGYSVRLMVTMLVSGGLLYLKWNKSRGWANIVNFRPWLDPAPAIICFVMSSAVFLAGFAHPLVKSTIALAWYVLPVIALTSPLWGALWWLCLQAIQAIRREELEVTRIPFIVQQDNGEWVQKAEIVDVQWRARVKDRKLESPA